MILIVDDDAGSAMRRRARYRHWAIA